VWAYANILRARLVYLETKGGVVFDIVGDSIKFRQRVTIINNCSTNTVALFLPPSVRLSHVFLCHP